MKSRILIVEDQFIEANTLKITLEKAGYMVCGIAMSYEQALPYFRMERPDIVLLDIFLKGKLTGIDLAGVLTKENIPFIYLSANSNPSTFDAAKATRPYGFLIKPFRERDVLMSLDIAADRHRHAEQFHEKQELFVQQLLTHAASAEVSYTQQRVLVAQAFKQAIPFEILVVDTDIESDDADAVFCCQRTGFDEFLFTSGTEYLPKLGISARQFYEWRNGQTRYREPMIQNGEEFSRACASDEVLNKVAALAHIRSRISLPLIKDGTMRMHVSFFSKQAGVFEIDHLEIVKPLRALLSHLFRSMEDHRAQQKAKKPVENPPIPKVSLNPFDGIIGNSPKLLRALDYLAQVAEHDTLVLLQGETGVGKEGLVDALHQLSGRKDKPLVKINCAAMPASLIESELFGFEKGAFTGANERRVGKFEQAQQGTLFLDEIGELPLETQAKLLRVLQEKEFERLGGKTTIKVEARIIVATNRNLHAEVTMGRFRLDLYYRLNIFPIVLPPLRERKEDIPLLASHFLLRHAQRNHRDVKTLSARAMDMLMAYDWPGNVRELQHLIERHIVLANSAMIDNIELPRTELRQPEVARSQILLQDDSINRADVIDALNRCNGKVSGDRGAAAYLGLTPARLYARMRKLGIEWKYDY